MMLKARIHAVLASYACGVDFSVSFSEGEGRGEYASNIALVRAKAEGKNPKALAAEIAKNVSGTAVIANAYASGPGFVNITIADDVLLGAVLSVHNLAELKISESKHISVEFVSANPTGPLHIGNARGGPIGDTVARVLERMGHHVTREYFYNDAGAQVDRFREALWYWYRRVCGVAVEGDDIQYSGAYMQELAHAAQDEYRRTLLDDGDWGKAKLLAFAFARLERENFSTLADIGIIYDQITRDTELLKRDTADTLAALEQKGVLLNKDGATWFAPKSAYLDEPAVVVKADGTPIYFANDIAYHRRKFAANDIVIDVLGEGHHGHIPKLQAVAETLGFPIDAFHVIVHGQVQLIRGGKPVSMSKREGNFVTAREVLDAVGRDAFRYFLLSYDPRSAMQFDLDLAREQSKQNPVYYIQYAHARATGILHKAGRTPDDIVSAALADPEAKRLLLRISMLPDVLFETAQDFAVQRIARHAYELARDFTQFYERVRIIGGDVSLEGARLGIVLCAKRAIAETLDVLGISAPEQL